jgi:hypothetical protein
LSGIGIGSRELPDEGVGKVHQQRTAGGEAAIDLKIGVLPERVAIAGDAWGDEAGSGALAAIVREAGGRAAEELRVETETLGADVDG